METKKQKVVKILKRIGIALSIGFNVLFLIAIIVGSSGLKNKSNNLQVACAESEVIKVDNQVNKKLISYDDSTREITLTSDELNTFSFVNLNNISVNGNAFSVACTVMYADFSFTTSTSNNVYVGNGWYYPEGSPSNATDFIGIKDGYFKYYSNGAYELFEYELIITVNSENYENIKQAIELDIQANSSNVNDGIFETLSSGVVAFIGSIGSGITAMTSVFYDSANSQLTTIGLLSVIVVAISLAYFLFRLIIGLIRMRG